MTIVAKLVDQRRDAVRHVDRKIIRKKRCTRDMVNQRRTKRPAAVSMALQRLFVSCRGVFKGLPGGTVPSPGDVQNLCHILDCMIPEDVGLSRDLELFNPESPIEGTPRVTYTTIYKCKNFSVLLLSIKALFFGISLSQHIPIYTQNSARLARMKSNSVFTAPCDTSVLYPKSGGNIHAFTAITPCVVLDVLGPPYSEEDGRDCSYYRDTLYTSVSNRETTITKEEGDSYGWLEEIEMPNNAKMEGIEYLGPQVIETI